MNINACKNHNRTPIQTPNVNEDERQSGGDSSPASLYKKHNQTPNQKPNVNEDEHRSGRDGIDGASLFAWPNNDLETVDDHKKMLHAILNNFLVTIKLSEFGFAMAKCDPEIMLMPPSTKNGFVDINIDSLDDELVGKKGPDFIMILLNLIQNSPCVREVAPFIGKRVMSFTSSIFETLLKKGATSTMDEIVKMGIDVFDYERLQFVVHYKDAVSLFIVTNCALVERTYGLDETDRTRRKGDPTTGGIHFDSSREHPTEMISGLIKLLMNEAWSRKHGLLAGSYSPFNQLAIATPKVQKQTKAHSSIYTCLIAIDVFKTRFRPFLDHDFCTNLVYYADRLVFAIDEVSRLRLEMKSCILFSFGSSKYMNPGLKSIKQPPEPKTERAYAAVSIKQPPEAKTEREYAAVSIKQPPEPKTERAYAAVDAPPRPHRGVTVNPDAIRKREDRRYNYLIKDQLPKLQKAGCVLPKNSQRRIKIWVGEYDGSFEDATQLTIPTLINTYGNKKEPFVGILVQKSGNPRCNLFAVEESRIQTCLNVYWERFIAVQKTGFMNFGHDSVPVAVIRWNNETKLVPKSSISDVAPGQMRQKKSPDRLSSEVAGKLTWKPTFSSSGKNKASTSSCSDGQFYLVYELSYLQRDGSRRARDPIVQLLLRQGNINQAVSEGLRLRGRPRNSRGRPEGQIEPKTERAYAAVDADHEAKKRLTTSLVFEGLTGRRSLDVASILPTGTPLPPRRRSIPTRNQMAIKESKIEKRPPLPSITTASKRSKQEKPKCSHPGCYKFQSRMHYPFCSTHKQNPRMCKKCQKYESRRRGGLCKGCFNKSNSAEELSEAKRCIDCKLRFSRQIGARCQECIKDGYGLCLNCHERKRQRKGGLCVKCFKEKRFDEDKEEQFDKDLLKEGLFLVDEASM